MDMKDVYKSNTAYCKIKYESEKICLTECPITDIGGSHFSRRCKMDEQGYDNGRNLDDGKSL